MFVDANVFIHAYKTKSAEKDKCLKFMEKINSGEQAAVTSPLVLDEVFFFFSEYKDIEFAKKVWKSITQMHNLRFLPVDEKAMSYFLAFVDEGLDATDAFHASTLKANGISTICSFDRGFDRLKGVKRQEPK